jgi:putative transposase
MPRLGRYHIPDQPLHIIQRGNNRGPVFFDPEDYRLYLGWLGEAAERYGVAIHGYVLMTNHVHLLATPRDAGAVSRMMQSLGRLYVRHVNREYRRTGTLWEGRYRAAPIEAEAHLLACLRYIELNPVRARMVRKPERYPWSSYRTHADGATAADPLLTEHALYLALGATPAARARSYRGLVEEGLDDGFMKDLRAATNGGWALGGDKWRAKVERIARRRATPRSPGRPRKEAPVDKRQGRLL